MNPLKLAALLAVCASTCAMAQDRPLHPDQFNTQLYAGSANLLGKQIVGLQNLYLTWGSGPWLDTGIEVRAGDDITLVLDGQVTLSRHYGIVYTPELATWARIGEQGPIFRGLRDTNTFKASHSGNLQLKLYPRGRWLDPRGDYLGEPPAFNPDEGGGVNVGIVRWNAGSDIDASLAAIASLQPEAGWAARELQRRRTPTKPLPDGWQELWELAPAQVFSRVPLDNGRGQGIHLHTRNDVSILQKDAAMPLTADTRLQWRWKVDKLPSAVSENQVPSHDYVSIAVEFDNGRDLTFYWSHDLPEGSHYHCPLPGWHDRETHVVARSGSAGLGQWLSEERNILEDYRKAIGGEPPTRITRVWLIGVSLFQHGEGEATFSDIVLRDGESRQQVY